MQSSDLAPINQPQQPVRPYWMGDCQDNMLWEVVQGDWIGRYIQLFCGCVGLVPNITGWVFLFEVKESLDPNDPVLLQVIWTEQNGGCAATALYVQGHQTAALPPARYSWDLKYMTPGGIVVTIARGELNVLPSTNTTLAPPLVQLARFAPPVKRNSRFEATMARIQRKQLTYYRARKT